MIRFAAAIVLGFALLYIQSLVVMQLTGQSAIRFTEHAYFFMMWFVNIGLVFVVLTHAKIGFMKLEENYPHLYQKWLNSRD